MPEGRALSLFVSVPCAAAILVAAAHAQEPADGGVLGQLCGIIGQLDDIVASLETSAEQQRTIADALEAQLADCEARECADEEYDGIYDRLEGAGASAVKLESGLAEAKAKQARVQEMIAEMSRSGTIDCDS